MCLSVCEGVVCVREFSMYVYMFVLCVSVDQIYTQRPVAGKRDSSHRMVSESVFFSLVFPQRFTLLVDQHCSMLL